MRIVCPNCAAAYDVPDQVLAGPPRAFRCARCAREWTPNAQPLPAGDAPVANPPVFDALVSDASMPPPRPVPVMPLPNHPAPAQEGAFTMPPLPVDRPPSLAIGAPLVEGGRIAHAPRAGYVVGIVGWVLTVAILALALVLAVLRQPQIEALWPASQRLYAMLGLH